MTSEQGIVIGIVLIIGYVGWLLTSIFLYRIRLKNRELEKRVKTLEKR
jgi:uncharacterized membrane protein YciS (DUF1049 family)